MAKNMPDFRLTGMLSPRRSGKATPVRSPGITLPSSSVVAKSDDAESTAVLYGSGSRQALEDQHAHQVEGFAPAVEDPALNPCSETAVSLAPSARLALETVARSQHVRRPGNTER